MTVNDRTRRLLAIGVLVVAGAFALPRFLTFTPYPRFGADMDFPRPEHVARVTNVVGPPSRGLLLKGDRLLSIDGHPGTQAEFRAMRSRGGFSRGPLALVVRRDGRDLRITLPPVQLGVYQRVRFFTFPLTAIVAAPLVAFLLVWRRPDLATAWTFLWFAVLQALAVLWDIFHVPSGSQGPLFRAYLTVYAGLYWFFPASFVHFMSVFPRPRWRSAWSWLVVAAYAAPPVIWMTGHPILKTDGPWYLWFQTIALPLGTLSLIDHYVRPEPDGRRPRGGERALALAVAATLLLNAALAFLWNSPQATPWLTLPVVRLATASITFAFLVSPVVVAFLIANDPVFDPRRIVVQSLPFALLSVVLAALYLGIVLVSQRLFAEATGEESMLYNVIAALVVAFTVAPLWTRTQHALDRLFGRDPEALRVALDQAGRELLRALDRDQLRRSVEEGLARGLKRRIALEWPVQGPPVTAAGEVLPEHAEGAVGNLLLQAGIRLENLALQEHRARSEREAIELREAATRAELRALQAQVQPHFLFNALNALAYLIETDPPAAQRFTERLADMLRYTVEAGNRPVALLSEEIGFVEDYLGVARERYETRLEFRYTGPHDLLSLAVPPLTLQPLVENSLKHGCAPDSPALHLELAACRNDGFVELVFSDDGIASPNGGPGLGTGLTNLEQRLRRFAGAGATVEAGARRDPPGPAGAGFVVRLRWPVPKGVPA